MGDALKAKGIATWNIEYRRLGQAGSGWPGTYLDVGRGVDYLRTIAEQNHLDLTRVIVVGHSAGLHLAMKNSF
jgi:acetyl esterase/lipase